MMICLLNFCLGGWLGYLDATAFCALGGDSDTLRRTDLRSVSVEDEREAEDMPGRVAVAWKWAWEVGERGDMGRRPLNGARDREGAGARGTLEADED